MDLWVQATQDYDVLRLSLGTGTSSAWWAVALWEDRGTYDARGTDSPSKLTVSSYAPDDCLRFLGHPQPGAGTAGF